MWHTSPTIVLEESSTIGSVHPVKAHWFIDKAKRRRITTALGRVGILVYLTARFSATPADDRTRRRRPQMPVSRARPRAWRVGPSSRPLLTYLSEDTYRIVVFREIDASCRRIGRLVATRAVQGFC